MINNTKTEPIAAPKAVKKQRSDHKNITIVLVCPINNNNNKNNNYYYNYCLICCLICCYCFCFCF